MLDTLFKVIYCLSAMTFGMFCFYGILCFYRLEKAAKAYLEDHEAFKNSYTYTNERKQI